MLLNRHHTDVALYGYYLAERGAMLSVTAPLSGLIVAEGVLTSIAFGMQNYQECEKLLHLSRALCLLNYLGLVISKIIFRKVMVAVNTDPEYIDVIHYNGILLDIGALFQFQFLCYC